jgi:hypothetical protein
VRLRELLVTSPSTAGSAARHPAGLHQCGRNGEAGYQPAYRGGGRPGTGRTAAAPANFDEFTLERYDAFTADFSVPASVGIRLGFTLDRKSGRLVRQTVSGDGLPAASIDYSDYLRIDGHWLPGRLEIRTADLPSSINLVVERWSLGKPLPVGFFETN